ncbi:MAG: response regulator [Elusimicrobia bacterium]|nr:response regulator [Elusimicrobiota bacterium]
MDWILVVDDDKNVVDLLMDFLQSKGYQATSANDARQSYIQAESLRPKLIITDVMMPAWGTGVDAYKNIRKNRYLKDVPIIFVTGLSPQEAQAMLVPVQDPRVRLMHKPVDLPALEKLVLEMLALAKLPPPPPPPSPQQVPWQKA